MPVDDGAVRWRPPAPARTLDAVTQVMLREARQQPLLVIFEDLHWIDAETQALLDGLVPRLGDARVLLLVNYRREYAHGWSGAPAYSELSLEALAAESASELLDAMLGADPGLAGLKELLAERRNPFFLEETIRTLVETRALIGERGAYRLAEPVQAIRCRQRPRAAGRAHRHPARGQRLLRVAQWSARHVLGSPGIARAPGRGTRRRSPVGPPTSCRVGFSPRPQYLRTR